MDDLLDAACEPPPPDDAQGGPSTLASHDIDIVPAAGEARTEKCIRIVKCGLRRAIALSEPDYRKFSCAVEEYVHYVSRALRRASLALLRHLVVRASTDVPVPDLFHQKDTFWKDWLRLATQGAATVGRLPGVEAVQDVMGPPPAPPVDVVALDQVVAYAAVTFRTAVLNNAYVPLIPRLTRLVKTTLRARALEADGGPPLPEAYVVMSQLRSKAPAFHGWPAWLREFADDVRRRLDMTLGEYLHDDWGKKLPFDRLFSFNMWMQRQFEDLGARRIALSPVFSVRRAHVRLDKRVLISLFAQLYPAHPSVANLRRIQALHGDERKQGRPGFLHPDKVMLPQPPKLKTKKACAGDTAAWEAQTEARKAHERQVAQVRRSPEYAAQLRQNRVLVEAVRDVTRVLFAKIPLPKSGGWTFDGSVTTDGVSVSLQYASVRIKPPPPPKPMRAPSSRKKAAAASGSNEYDTGLSTYIASTNTLVLGVDPGRVSIATVSYVLDEATNKLVKAAAPSSGGWSLSRAEYRACSGIRDLDAAKARRYETFSAQWSALGAEGAALRTSRVEDVDLYLGRLAQFEGAWWEAALRRRESRDALRRYSGKRRALDGFFARIRRQLDKMMPDVNIQVAYGSAAMTMKPSGRGEVAVPTTGAFHACRRAFGREAVSVTDEAYSTKVDWETGTVKHAVYATFALDERGEVVRKVASTPSRWMPRVPEVERPLIQQQVDRLRDEARRRRSGLVTAPTAAAPPIVAGPPPPLRYPEVRGLRFCPERRMYQNRDRSAARTIARLRTLELLGLPRPAPFCR